MRNVLSTWLLVAGFLAIGGLNLAINPDAVEVLYAQGNCEDDPPCDPEAEQPCCDEGSSVQCVCGTWMCVPDEQP